ncbi:UMP-CMP kinase [Coccidioides immitis H538.4]|uniref:UMP-CMP kinase n=1 Tax=Coccidioides immitis H538.4 TaxID=396776 RepID=A0A0J8S211_COCIT|nr:UMP-CMP kinase [Coccidioides immitis H538.4]
MPLSLPRVFASTARLVQASRRTSSPRSVLQTPRKTPLLSSIRPYSAPAPHPKPNAQHQQKSEFKIFPIVVLLLLSSGSYVLLVSLIFVLGGPGRRKGTQSAHLVREYALSHLSAGDLLRAEQNREESQYGELIRNYVRECLIVPMEITVALLSNAMSDILAEKKGAEPAYSRHTITVPDRWVPARNGPRDLYTKRL